MNTYYKTKPLTWLMFLIHYPPSLPDITLIIYIRTGQRIETSEMRITRERTIRFNFS